jgi:hypothetical protein
VPPLITLYDHRHSWHIDTVALHHLQKVTEQASHWFVPLMEIDLNLYLHYVQLFWGEHFLQLVGKQGWQI